jgi:hypothetical protein
LPERIGELARDWPRQANRVGAFWQAWKRTMALRLDADVRGVSGLAATPETVSDQVSVIITTSPISAHPSTEHLECTVQSVRAQLPAAEILVVADGVRPEQAKWADAYEEYLRRLVRLCGYQWRNVLPIICEEWGHQANAVRRALSYVEAPLVLMVEHDTPLCGDIDWGALVEVCVSGEANQIRLHFDVAIHPDHESIMLDHQTVHVPTSKGSVPLRRSVAHWQRPHLARTDYYRNRIMPLFTPESRTMIEDWLYGIVWRDWDKRGDEAWDDWRIWMYTPEPDMQRSTHLDSRAGHPKYEMRFPQ